MGYVASLFASVRTRRRDVLHSKAICISEKQRAIHKSGEGIEIAADNTPPPQPWDCMDFGRKSGTGTAFSSKHSFLIYDTRNMEACATSHILQKMLIPLMTHAEEWNGSKR
eukprot:2530407-Amphidinium_carterae.1